MTPNGWIPVFALNTFFNKMRTQFEKEELERMRKDPANYILGFIYYNPRDPRFFVSKRFGIGWTFNMAHPGSWLSIVAIIALAVIIFSLRKP
jgi:uncharacterized membrane protein